MEIKLISKKKENTLALGKIIASFAFKGEVIILSGDLGAGKTTLTKGIGKELGVKEEINSPTFNILKCYFSSKLPLYHIDAYRLEDIPRENKNIGLEEVIEGDGVAIIEWPKFIEEFINYDDVLDIVIKINENNEREFTIYSKNEKFLDLFNKLKKEYKLWLLYF